MDAVKVLMVDDEARMRKLVKDFLAIKGYKVIEAEDGEQAVDIFFKEKDIGLVILDVMMPKMDGWEVLKTIRKYSQVPDPPPLFPGADHHADGPVRGTGRASGV